MGRKLANKGRLNAAFGSQPQISMTVREESTGKKQGNVNVKTMLKLDHLKNLAIWASGEAAIPSLGAFFGERLAASNEAMSIHAEPSLFLCERCESILQPGQNCTVRIEKINAKMRCRRRKMKISTKNNVVYRCHFCSHRNLLRGTSKAYMKEICTPKAKPPSKSDPAKSDVPKCPILPKVASTNIEVNDVNTVGLPMAAAVQGPSTSSPATPLPRTGISLLESKRRKRSRSCIKKVSQTESSPRDANAENTSSASNKRKRKSWTSLKDIAKDIAESSKNDDTKLTNLTIPIFI
ncbi:RNAse P [Abeliophyllum distichum]|uniref:RNAse P n=1 Tax=Abeliophyllum distichum TaxID=126358 RepID=A0ABD1SZG4_9LAMI